MLFTERLMLLINQKGISRNKMLVDLQLGKNSFINWETRGNTPDGETLLKISQYFGVTVDYLLGMTPQKEEICQLCLPTEVRLSTTISPNVKPT